MSDREEKRIILLTSPVDSADYSDAKTESSWRSWNSHYNTFTGTTSTDVHNRMSNVIKAIDRSTVHRICSGQVVLSLAIAVKELVENAIDAGATVVEVKLKEYGSELIEVSDNGHGVHPDNYEGLTLKHHTSKLRDFADLTGVETFGFRGEALSSLCALSELSVSTRHTSLDCGSNLTFDRNGRIVENVPYARQVGTTVSLMNIFSTLPVRHKEFHRNLKKEFNKMLQLLYAYCLVSTGVRISCSNQTKKGGKSILLATQGNATVKENVSCIFGAKQLTSLLEFKETLPPPDILEQLKMTEESCSIFKLEGLISSCAHGSGRGAPDRQFYFINSRPCEPSKISKTVNEVYHQYNLHQYPFIFLNISVAKDSVDVNVTPDKRQIFLDNEKLLIAIVKASLETVFKIIPSTFVLNNIVSNKVVDKSAIENNSASRKPNLSIFSQWRSRNDSSKRCLEDADSGSQTKVQKLDPESDKRPSQMTLSGFVTKISPKRPTSTVICCETNYSERENAEPCDNFAVDVSREGGRENGSDLRLNGTNFSTESLEVKVTPPSKESQMNSGTSAVETHQDSNEMCTNVDDVDVHSGLNSPKALTVLATSPEVSLSFEESVTPNNEKCDDTTITCDDVTDSEPAISKSLSYDTYVERDKKYTVVPVDISFVKSVIEKRVTRNNAIDKVKFRAAIDPSTNNAAENELRKEISKEKFEKMEIVGQFNLGFIIAKLDQDLFIIDQHASDEKFNFETLQKSTTIRSQKLVVPQLLELTAANESVLTENLEIFKKNGFEFKINEEAPPTRRVSMTAVPLSINRVFGKEDVDELLFMLQDAHDKDLTCRPSGVRAMFASRACRKSVMVGTALDHKEMKRLVSQMGTIEHPWNCPHGRPTMRHLVNMELVRKVTQ